VVAALLAAFSYAFYNIAGYDLVERIDRGTVLLYATLSASMFWIFVNPPGKIVSAHYSSGQWLFLLVFAIVSMLGPFLFTLRDCSIWNRHGRLSLAVWNRYFQF